MRAPPWLPGLGRGATCSGSTTSRTRSATSARATSTGSTRRPSRRPCRAGGAPSLAARFAAKEAVLKLIGTADGVDPRSIEIDPRGGRPVVRLSGARPTLAAEAGVGPIDVSLSHSGDLALAVAVAISPPDHHRPTNRGTTQHEPVRHRHHPRAPGRARPARRRRRVPVRHRRPVRRRHDLARVGHGDARLRGRVGHRVPAADAEEERRSPRSPTSATRSPSSASTTPRLRSA